MVDNTIEPIWLVQLAQTPQPEPEELEPKWPRRFGDEITYRRTDGQTCTDVFSMIFGGREL